MTKRTTEKKVAKKVIKKKRTTKPVGLFGDA